jgi:PKD repeat protein
MENSQPLEDDMTLTTITSMTRRTITMALSLLLAAIAFLALANPAGAIPVGGGPGDDPIPHNQPPNASFTISPNPAIVSSQPLAVQALAHLLPGGGAINQAIQSGDLVTFDGSTSSDDHKILNYEWDLDGNGSYETHGITAKIEHKRYFQTGIVKIRLRVSDAQGLKDVATHDLTIRNAPHAVIKSDVAVPLVGQQVNYSAVGSTGDPAIKQYDWDLDGNGTFETPTGTVPTANASYQSAGTRNIRVRVTDTLGTTAIDSIKEIVNQAPVAAFTDAPSPAFTGETVTFDGSSSSDDNTIADYAWDLDGNGTFETDTHAVPTTTKKYATAGLVTVRLRVTDDQGVQNTVSHALIVKDAPAGGTTATTATNPDGTPDTTAPKVTITPRSVKLSNKGIVTLKVTCPKTERSCAGRLSLTRTLKRAHTAKVGSGTFRAGGGQTATVRVHLSAANRKLVKRLHTLTTKASAVATDAAGNTATANATIKIKR